MGVTQPSAVYILQVVQSTSLATNVCQFPIKCIASPRIPDAPQNLNVVFTKPDGTNRSSATLSWRLSTALDGKSVSFTGSIDGYLKQSQREERWDVNQSQADPRMYSYTVQNLLPGNTYTISIKLHVEDWKSTSLPASISFLVPEDGM
ncbi:AGAP011650-PA-like protein [Anopheles sinensis]|uniref:AGAP011650-PA-like protein n=1 Tax=Anopheles sinensis TaxID=74873 RepID=A0A084VIA4_ANOSI|nr:AGAP011650-PA-like protein [Anopheles sinensis]